MWHKELVPILPQKQLVGQWRECILIAKELKINGTPNHILVNRVRDYSPEHLATYCDLVKWAMLKQGFAVNVLAMEKLIDYLGMPVYSYVPEDFLFDQWHTDRYLWQCLSNLEEKYDCGGIPEAEWEPIDQFIAERL